MQIGTQKLWTRANGNTYRTHCKNGHEFTDANTYISPKSQKRTCQICNAARVKERFALDVEGNRLRQRDHMREWRAANKDRDHKNWTELRRAKKQWLDTQKESGCSKCDEKDPACIDFHHRDPEQKEANLSVAIAHWSIERLKTEVAKCDLICANCHRKLHASERALEG